MQLKLYYLTMQFKYIKYAYILVIFLVSSCSYVVRNGYEKTENKHITVFQKKFTKTVYRASIDVYYNHFSGLIVIKKDSITNNYRVVFLSELGLKIFDFAFSENQNENFKINYILEPINKPIIINAFKKDFELLLQTNQKNSEIKTYTNNINFVNEIKHNKLYNYYIVNKDSAFVNSIIQKKRFSKKIIVTNTGFSNYSPDKIYINHKGIKLKIVLTKM